MDERFFSFVCPPNKPRKVECDEFDIHLSLATMVDPEAKKPCVVSVKPAEDDEFTPLCILKPKVNPTQIINTAFFPEDAFVIFKVEGPCGVSFTGQCLSPIDSDEDEEEEEEPEDEEVEDLKVEGKAMKLNEPSSSESEESEEEEEVKPVPPSKKRKMSAEISAPPAPPAKKKKIETPKKPKAEPPKKPVETPKKPVETPKKPKHRNLGKGLKYIEINSGAGPQPARGQKVKVNYVGKLKNGKIFDQGKNFIFKCGVGEVIKGWDIGVGQMCVGDKGKLIIPAPLAYGSQGAPPDIPRNAQLEFEVELTAIRQGKTPRKGTPKRR